jgi:hypothetical protein
MSQPDVFHLACSFLIAWLILSAWFMGKVLDCLESIAKSLMGKP